MLTELMLSTYHSLVYDAPTSAVATYGLTHCPDCGQEPHNVAGRPYHPTRNELVVMGCKGTPVLDPNLLGIACPQWGPWHAAKAAEAVRSLMNSWLWGPVYGINRYARLLLAGQVSPDERDVVRIIQLIADDTPDMGEWWVNCVQMLHRLADGGMSWLMPEFEDREHERYGEPGWDFYEDALEGRVTLSQLARFCGGDLLRAAKLIAGTDEDVAQLSRPRYHEIKPPLERPQARLDLIARIAREGAAPDPGGKWAVRRAGLRAVLCGRPVNDPRQEVLSLITSLADGTLTPESAREATTR